MTRPAHSYRGYRRNSCRSIARYVHEDGFWVRVIFQPRKKWPGIEPTTTIVHPPTRPNRARRWDGTEPQRLRTLS